ncbi:unnamed protein product [Effrenium voratum]|nr:unnamed protein product [Effrenium voratum]
MSDMELLITFFFAALEQWLESRFLRLADLVAQRMPWSLEELEEGGNSAPQRFPEKRARRSAIAPKEDTSVPPSPMSVPERRRLLVRQETHTELKVKEEKKKEGRLEEKKERKEKGLTVTVKEERNPTVQLPPWLTLSASELLEIASPPGQAPLLSTKELQQCFRMLLKDSRPNPEIAVYQLDKVLSKAKAAYDHASVGDCFMLKPDSVLSASERVTRQFLQALDERLSERAARGGSYKIEGIFGDAAEVTPSMFIRKAISIALSPDMIPAEKDLAMNLAQIGGAPNGNMSRPMAFRVLALAREYKRRQRVQNMKARSALLAQQSLRSAWCPEGSRPSSRRGPLHPPQLRKAFRVAAFVECLVKLALHRLGSKGLLELQRGAPTWWKCTWLLNFLGIRFIEGVRDKEHRQSLKETVGEAQPDVKNKELDFWWYRMHLRDRLQYVAPGFSGYPRRPFLWPNCWTVPNLMAPLWD